MNFSVLLLTPGPGQDVKPLQPKDPEGAGPLGTSVFQPLLVREDFGPVRRQVGCRGDRVCIQETG